MQAVKQQLEDNLRRVQERIAKAAESVGRRAEEVKMVAVTKYVPAEIDAQLVELGCKYLGESRPQQLWRKAESLAGLPVEWHLVGHLQRNKVRRTLPVVDLIHSVDSIRLLETIERVANEQGRKVNVLLEVNVSGDESKHGFSPGEMSQVVTQLDQFPHVEVRGLMCMASLYGGADVAQRNFAQLAALRDKLQQQCPSGTELKELSMGMSDDFEIAIREGATIVRIGSALFEGIELATG